jgi:polar amino acid transport system substrate-binding protein
MSTNRSLTALAIASALALSVSACGSDDGGGGGGSDSGLDLVKSGTLTVCSDVPYAPFEDFDKSTPTGFKGFDVDIVSNIADQMGVKLAIKDSDFDALQSGLLLNSRQCDMAASAMTITPERAERIGFSDPYYDSEQSLLVPTGSDIKSIGDLDGKTLGVQKGTTGEAYAKEHVKGAKIVSMKDDGTEFQALKAGTVDALLQDLPVNLTHTEDGEYTIVEKYDTGEQYGFAFKKDNTALLDEVNKDLEKMKGDGTYQKLYDKYFQQQ